MKAVAGESSSESRALTFTVPEQFVLVCPLRSASGQRLWGMLASLATRYVASNHPEPLTVIVESWRIFAASHGIRGEDFENMVARIQDSSLHQQTVFSSVARSRLQYAMATMVALGVSIAYHRLFSSR